MGAMSEMVTSVIGALGWVGAAMCLTGYFLVSSKRIMGDSLRYHALNMGGASLLSAACVITGAWPSFISNFVFIIIGCVAIWNTKRAYLAMRMRMAAQRAHQQIGGGLHYASRRAAILTRRA